MKKLVKLTALASIAALAITITPLGWNFRVGWLGDTAAFAAGNSGANGNSGSDHGNSGDDHGNSGGSQASKKEHSGDSAVTRTPHRSKTTDVSGKSVLGKNVVSLAGVGNAAHASVRGLLHASPNSAVGRLRTYADLNYLATSGKLQSNLVDTQKAFDAAYPNFADLSADEKAAAVASPEGVALADAKTALADADQKANDAFALVTRNPGNPAVKTYIDGLLGKYYSYLASL
ncbi:MAG: hypothetical protein JWN11_2809 [Hyphomicrobiales bacterium]|nr:hypothetical protein [Hyphomicrobiales bacterium]